MARDSYLLDPKIYEYVLANSLREPEVLARLRAETASHPDAIMQVPPEQGQLLGLLVKMIHARRTLEVGVYTGYSTLAVAMALPPNGQVIACDVSEDFTSVARRYWEDAGVKHKIDLRIAPAADTLDRLIAAGETNRFDFAFIDADKPNYSKYYEQCLSLVRSGGLIALDNMLQRGRVLDPQKDHSALAIDNINRFIHDDARVDALLLPIADGLTLAVKR